MSATLLESVRAKRFIQVDSIDPTAFYQVAECDHQWQVVKRSNGVACCICRTLNEAIQLTISLNRDQAQHPKEHRDRI